mmetsp:Transcript_20377/g.18047  ORF Transcript_20377/g.18047 Transcript_20377/m.18047 type:complete len:166 (+) Transcript_20377:104-601(+)
MNLISNSYKFTQKGYIKVSVIPYQELNLEGPLFLKFIVEDTGIGISEKEDKPNLFKMFGMIRTHRDTFNLKGTGLGLTISEKLVTLLGGKIHLHSRDKGTTFEFTIAEKKYKDLEESKGDFKEDQRPAFLHKFLNDESISYVDSSRLNISDEPLVLNLRNLVINS